MQGQGSDKKRNCSTDSNIRTIWKKAVENTVINRNVSENKRSKTARGDIKRVTYAEAVKKEQ